VAELDAFNDLLQVSTTAVNALRFLQSRVQRDPVCLAHGGYYNIDRCEICVMLGVICNNIKGVI
jgi:hypothetical protein